MSTMPHDPGCPDCKGRGGYIVHDSVGDQDWQPCERPHRESENADTRTMLQELEAIHRDGIARLVRRLFQERREHEQEVQSLVAQNRALRVIVRDQQRLLDRAEPVRDCERVGIGRG